MATGLAVREENGVATVPKIGPLPDKMEAVLIDGDISKFNVAERKQYYLWLCDLAGVHAGTQPFGYFSFEGKLQLYAKKSLTEQISNREKASNELVSEGFVNGTKLYKVVMKTRFANGRETTDVGAVVVNGASNQDANAIMKAFTKAKRRGVLSLSGLVNLIDESELDTMDGVRFCDDNGNVEPPKNNSGHGRGQYCSQEQADEYLKAMQGYLDQRNAQWFDQWTKDGQDAPKGVKELANRWQLDNHLVKWAKETGRLDPASCGDEGVKNRQIGLYSGIVWHKSIKDQNAMKREMRDYLDRQMALQTESLAVTGELIVDDEFEGTTDIDPDYDPIGDRE